MPHWFKLIAIFLLVNFHTLQAAELENTGFKHISTEHGLSQKTVQSIYQDSVGFMWIGTQEGLNRYDGREVKVFRHIKNKTNSISHDVIRDIVEDPSGRVWIASSGGLDQYLAASETFKHIPLVINQNDTIQRLNTLFIDSSGWLWVGTNGNGVVRLNTADENPKFQMFNKIPLLAHADVRAIFEDSRGRIWIGTDGSGVFLMSGSEVVQFIHDENDNNSISHDRIRSIVEDYKGRIWLATRGGGLNRFEELSKKFISYHASEASNSLSHDRVYRVFQDRQQTLWIATDNGLSVYQPETDDFMQIKHLPSQQSGLNHNRVLSLYQDNGGLLWIGTLAGLNQWNPLTASFVHYRHISEIQSSLSDNTVYAFAQNKQGKIFIGTFGGGLNYLDSSAKNKVGLVTNEQGESLTDKRISSLMVDKKNNLWVGSVSNGVDVFSPTQEKLLHFENQANDETSLSANGITSLFQDSDGEIWISTYQAGLNRLNQATGKFFHYRADSTRSHQLLNENVFQVIEDDEGYIWLATDGGGIARLDKHTNQFVNFSFDANNPQSLSGNSAWSIFQDSKGRFWVGTQGSGLNRWEVEDRRRGINRFQHYTVENGLNSSTVNGVMEDDQGLIWISSNRGVSKLNPDTNAIQHFNLSDELHYNEFNQGAMLKTKNGRLLLGGLRGVSAFFPEDVTPNPYMPPVVLTRVMSGNELLHFEQPLRDIKEMTFNYQDYLIAFEFAALDFTQPQKNNYQYQLVGLDENWINNGHLNRATFTNLPAGKYELRVRGSNNDGLWSTREIKLKINVLPAPWVSWWAFALYGVAFILLLVFVIRLQAKRLANQEMFRQQVSQSVADKTVLYVKNNDFLKEQIEQLKAQTNVDLATGIPNQKYLFDILKLLINLAENFKEQHAEYSRIHCIAIIRFPQTSYNLSIEAKGAINRIIKLVAMHYINHDAQVKLITRWSENELGIIGVVKNFEECQLMVKALIKTTKSAMLEFSSDKKITTEYKSSYLAFPFSGVSQDILNADKLMMLVEHLLHLVALENASDLVGIKSINQKLNNVNFQQIMAAKRLSDLAEIFTLEKSI